MTTDEEAKELAWWRNGLLGRDKELRHLLDIALWLMKREPLVEKVKAYYGANIDETDVLQAIDEVIEWEKKHPRPGSKPPMSDDGPGNTL